MVRGDLFFQYVEDVAIYWLNLKCLLQPFLSKGLPLIQGLAGLYFPQHYTPTKLIGGNTYFGR